MTDQTFEGNVGQVAGRDVNNESAAAATASSHVNNLVSVNLGRPQAVLEPITRRQRNAIYRRTRELSDLTGTEVLSVYDEILTEFGIEKISQLPKAKFKEVTALINARIVQARHEPSDITRVAEPKTSEIHIHHPACQGCGSLSAQINLVAMQLKATRRWLTMTTALLVALCGGIGWGFAAGGLEAKGLDRGPSVCHFDGRAYSLGSVITVPKSKGRECLIDSASGTPYWATLAVERGR